MTTDTDFFPAFIAEEKAKEEVAASVAISEGHADHWRSVRTCWPDWEGPIITADDTDPAGWCSVGQCVVHSITHCENRYHYCAPCRILEILEDGNTLIVEVRYPTGPDARVSWCAEAYNGERLRLTGSEIWVPVDMMWERRHAASVKEAIATGKTCACGEVPAHVYGGGFECVPCRETRMAELSARSAPVKKARNRKTASQPTQ